MGEDVRHALRGLLRSPGFTTVAVLTLALGIGATTALFSVGYGVLLQALPYADADRLVIVRAEQDFDGAPQPVPAKFPFAALSDWPARPTFESVAFFSAEVAAVTNDAGSELIDIAVVSQSFFDTLQGEMARGRALTPADFDQPVVVISERLWRRLLAASPDVLGQPLTLTGVPYTIVGVARDTLQIPVRATDVWLPAGVFRARQPACCGFTPLVRLNAGVTPDAAQAEAEAVTAGLASAHPRTLHGARARVVALRDAIVGDAGPAIVVLAAAVTLLLVLASANVVNLLLARTSVRSTEVAVRRALGAPRSRLFRQALAESAILTTAGGVLGVGLAALVIQLLRSDVLPALPRLDAIHLDGTVWLFAVTLMMVLAMAVAAVPALGSPDAIVTRLQARGATNRPASRLALRALTVSQLAISVVLLVGAALLSRSLSALMSTDFGVRPDGVATASLNLAMGRSLTDRQQIDLVDRVIARISALPGVTAAGVGTARPPDVSRVRLTLSRSAETRAAYQAQGVPATPGYFTALGMRLERGRYFSDADGTQAAPVAMMSSDTARRLFGNDDPLGRTFRLPVLRDGRTTSENITIVGLTAPVKYGGLDRGADDAVYRPFAQQAWRAVYLVARTTGDPSVLAGQLEREIAAVDRAIVISDVATLDAVLADETAEPRLRTLLLASLAIVAVLVAGVGLSGVVAYSVSQRIGEMGIRVALGADGWRILRMVLAEGMILVALGTACGLAAALGAAQLVTSLLHGVTASDPASYALAAAAVAVCGLMASAIPAARASRTNPVDALKAE